MTERRKFIKALGATAVGSTLLGLFSPTGQDSLWAATDDMASKLGNLPLNIIYTQDNQGKWDGKAGSHLPIIGLKNNDGKINLNIETKHGMSEKHYIVRHTIVNGHGQVLGGKTFHWDDKPLSQAIINLKDAKDAKSKDLYALSFCNKHDLWMAKTKLA